MIDLNGKVALITGAGGYIGGETAALLARQGAAVAVCDLSEDAVRTTVARIAAEGGTAKGYRTDVSDSADVNGTVEKIVGDFGRLDISVHAAGGSARLAGADSYARLIEQRDEVIDTVLKVNLYGAIYVARACGAVMVKQGAGGRIISLSSAVGINGLSGCTEYAAAKGGVMSLTKSLAKELGVYGITVNAVAPGVVMRPDETGGEARGLNTNFLRMKCLASDVARLIAFMASEDARFITGQTYIIDGGRTLAMKGSD